MSRKYSHAPTGGAGFRMPAGPRRRGRRWPRLVVAGALAGVVAPAPAHAAFKVEQARFKVKLTAKQTSSWSVNRRDPFEICGLTFNGDGRFDDADQDCFKTRGRSEE